jgi:hypothetical protein
MMMRKRRTSTKRMMRKILRIVKRMRMNSIRTKSLRIMKRSPRRIIWKKCQRLPKRRNLRRSNSITSISNRTTRVTKTR